MHLIEAMPGMRRLAAACYVAATSKKPDRMIAGFTSVERDYIRHGLEVAGVEGDVHGPSPRRFKKFARVRQELGIDLGCDNT